MKELKNRSNYQLLNRKTIEIIVVKLLEIKIFSDFLIFFNYNQTQTFYTRPLRNLQGCGAWLKFI